MYICCAQIWRSFYRTNTPWEVPHRSKCRLLPVPQKSPLNPPSHFPQGNCYSGFCYYTLVLLVTELYINLKSINSVMSGCFCWMLSVWGSSILVHAVVILSYCYIIIPFKKYPTIYLLIVLIGDIWVIWVVSLWGY